MFKCVAVACLTASVFGHVAFANQGYAGTTLHASY